MNRFLIVLALPALLLTLPAQAQQKYDLDFSRLGTVFKYPDGTSPQYGTKTDQRAFDAIVRDLGLAMAPKFMGPAATLGALGFEIAYEASWTEITENKAYWEQVLADGETPDDALVTSQLHVRKGLPFSLELGGTLTHLHQSSIWGVGLDLKYALLEGFRLLPDLAIRSNVHTILGQESVHMLLTGGDVILSKEFGLGGLFRVAPFVGYNLVYIYGSSHQITFFENSDSVELDDGTSPTDCNNTPDDLATGKCTNVDLFNSYDGADAFEHRGVIGVQVVASYVSLGGEVALGSTVRTYTVHVGVDF